MKFISNIFNWFGYTKRSGTTNPAQWLIDWVTGGSATSSGARVNESTALKYTPFWASVRVISGTLASLPFIVYKRLDKGKERVADHRVYNLLHNRPNPYMDALTFIETRQAHVLTYGNGYAEIQRDGGGRPIALWPLLPDRTFRKIDKISKIPYYEVRSPTGETAFLPDENVLHIKGLGFDGLTGYNVVAFHKEAIGYGVAVKEFASRFFGNGANPGGILQHPETLSDGAQARLRKSVDEQVGGLSKAHRMLILEEGMKWAPTGVDPKKAQAIEVQKYNVDDCSRIFNIPPHKIGSLERATFSNIEEQNIDFVTQTMFYWFRKWETECNYKLFMPSEKGRVFCEILVDGLLRGNTKARYEAYNIGRQAGFLCVDDIRDKENMNPLPDGEGQIFLEPLNMKPAGEELPPKDDVPDDVSQAHKDLLASQWRRVVAKQEGTGKSQAGFARTILFEPLKAFASLFEIPQSRVVAAIDSVIEEKLPDQSNADVLADELIKELKMDKQKEDKQKDGIETRSLPGLELRDEGDKPRLVGYAAKYGTFTDLGWVKERIKAGAFDDVLKDNDVRCLKNHEPSLILGRTKNNTLRLESNTVGLRFDNDIPNTTTGKDTLEEVRRGDLSGCSFAFTVAEDEWKYFDDDRQAERTIIKIGQLFDVGPVTYPAYTNTTVAARSLESCKETAEEEKRQKEAEAEGEAESTKPEREIERGYEKAGRIINRIESAEV